VPPAERTKTFVFPNEYEPGRAHVVVYNYDRRKTVSASLDGAGLKAGEAYEILDAQNPLGPAVRTGTFAPGKPVELPMDLTAVARWAGTNVEATGQVQQPVHTSPEFGVFLVRRPRSTP